ncbi:MAG: hypothetical protein ACXIVO_08760 [Glycocaulis sp.]
MLPVSLARLLGLRSRTIRVRPVPLMVAELPRSRHYCLKGRRPVLKPDQRIRLRRPTGEGKALEAWCGGYRIGQLHPEDVAEVEPLLACGQKLEAWIAAPAGGQGRPVRVAMALQLRQ